MKEVGENARRAADMLGYCAFGRGQPKRAERDVMRTPWLGSCSWQPARARTLRPWDKAMAAPAVEMPGLPGTAAEPGAPDPKMHAVTAPAPQVIGKHTSVMADPDVLGCAAR